MREKLRMDGAPEHLWRWKEKRNSFATLRMEMQKSKGD